MIFLEVLGHPGQYIDTLDMKFHQPLWVSGHVGQSFELIVMVRILIPKSVGVEGGAPGTHWWLDEGAHEEMGTPVRIVWTSPGCLVM